MAKVSRARAKTGHGLIVAAMLTVAASPFAAHAYAAEGDQVVQVQGGQLRCLLSEDYQGRGRPMAVCGHSDGSPFGASPMSEGKYPQKLNLAVYQSTGEQYWEAGTIPGSPAGDAVVNVGQTYRANGWTVTEEPLRTIIRNDTTGHKMVVNVVSTFAM